jgi:hypothetical protein
LPWRESRHSEKQPLLVDLSFISLKGKGNLACWQESSLCRIKHNGRGCRNKFHVLWQRCMNIIIIAELMIKASVEKLQIDFNGVLMAKESGFALFDFSAEAALLLKAL